MVELYHARLNALSDAYFREYHARFRGLEDEIVDVGKELRMWRRF